MEGIGAVASPRRHPCRMLEQVGPFAHPGVPALQPKVSDQKTKSTAPGLSPSTRDATTVCICDVSALRFFFIANDDFFFSSTVFAETARVNTGGTANAH